MAEVPSDEVRDDAQSDEQTAPASSPSDDVLLGEDGLPIDEDARDDAMLAEHDSVEFDDSRGGQRVISVIFASIAGFETTPSMTQDQMEDIAVRKGGFDAALDEIISKYGGSIDKIIRGFFMATFGTQRSTPNDPMFAVLAAMEMTETAEQYGAEVHVGVNTGKAWVGQIRTERTIDTTVIGDTVNLSARLKTKAGHNEVVVSPAAYDATIDYFEYEALPAVMVKGISEPVPIYGVRRRKEAATALQATREADADRLKRLEESIPEYLRERIKSGQTAAPGERKMVTMLFSDVSGFTALSEKYKTKPELIAEVMNRCHKRLGDIIYKHEGVIDKIVGDELMAMFGAPIIHEDDPERAIWCALEMMEEMQRFSDETQEELGVPPLTVHIGINTGRVSIGNLVPGSTRMDYTVIGEPVELAEILEDVSEGGEIVVGERTYRLTRALIDFKTLDPVELGGKMVPIYLVLGKKDQTESKRGLTELGNVPMVGREAQFELSKKCLERAMAGESVITTIIGEAGFGKSRLKRETRAILEQHGGVWIEGSCFPNTVTSSYSVFLRAFEAYLGLKESDTALDRRIKLTSRLEQVFGGDQAAMDEVLPYIGNMLSVTFEGPLADRIAYLDPEQLQRRTWVAVRDLLAREVSQRPVILALDDLHWLDSISNDLIYFLMENLREVPIYLMLIYRPERRDLCWALGETAQSKYASRYELIEITPLVPEAARRLIDIMLPMTEEGKPIKEMLLDKAGGNPFYLEEFIRVLLDDDFIERSGDIWVLKKDVSEFRPPDSLEQMLSARIDKLDDASKVVLQTASVIGRKFEHEVLEDVVDDTAKLDDCLSYLTDLNFVYEEVPDPLAYVFGHIVTYEISYNAIVGPHRRELHSRVGSTLETQHVESLELFLELLAFHFVQSTNRHKAVHYSGAAGTKSRRYFNNKDACTSYERGLEIADQLSDADRDDVLEILEGLTDVYTVIGRYDDAVSMSSRSLVLVEAGLRRAVLLRKSGLIRQKRSEFADADGFFDQALEALEQIEQTPETIREGARLYDMKGFISYTRGSFPDANEKCRRAVDMLEGMDAPDVMCSALKNLGSIQLRLGQFDTAMGYYRQAVEIGERIGDKLLMSALYHNMSAAHRLQGKTADAIEAVRRSIELKEEMAYADGLTRSYAGLGSLLRQQGDMDKAREHYEKALEIAENIGSPQGIAEAETLIGAFYFYLKDYTQAIAHYTRGLEISRSIGDRQNEVSALNNICDAYIYANDLDAAEQFGRDAEALAKEIGMQQVLVKAQVNLGTLMWKRSRPEEAISEFRAALESAVNAKDATAQAEIYRNLGDIYLEQNDPDQARENLTKAADLYAQLGSASRAEDIRKRIPA